ncbi:hypothetical protein LTR78_009685 [Recurvomyces mirabilis]|uniref:Monooxygenase n=1 Tax=Recurvomyces mirabilis TaxID=574656 RepID=A0AAE0TP64_9PEZI|nr:hypothetical protein LTR78_009685 [Recurvomyces mirabilis]KAK5150273.1 hypothetical protein LTS14_010249 [Recurvomyces mirabilis]
MLSTPKPFTSLLPSTTHRPRSAFFGPAASLTLIRDQLTLPTWLSIGALLQGLLFLVIGRLALAPAFLYLCYNALKTYAMATGWIKNTYMDGVVKGKYSAQFPDETGDFKDGKPSSQDVVVLLIGMRVNHPLGILAPGLKDFGGFFQDMTKDLDKHGEEFGYLGMTSWINTSQRETKSELLNVAYFRSTEGLHKFAMSEYHMTGWNWWNKHTKQYPHLSIYHEIYHAPAGHWENIYVNSHISNFASTAHKMVDQETGEEKWASPVVDASKASLRSMKARMGRGED